MFAIKTILAHPNAQQLKIMEGILKYSTNDHYRFEIAATVQTISDLYRCVKKTPSVLIILDNSLFTPCINLLTGECNVIIITDNRKAAASGNVHYSYVPVQAIQLMEQIKEFFADFTEEEYKQKLHQIQKYVFDLHLPISYCGSIDTYCVDMNWTEDKGTTPFVQRQYLLEHLKKNKIPINQIKEKFSGVPFRAADYFNPKAMKLVEVLEPSQSPSEEVASMAPAISSDFDPFAAQKQIALSNSESDVVLESVEKEETVPLKHGTTLAWDCLPSKTVYRIGEPFDFKDAVILQTSITGVRKVSVTKAMLSMCYAGQPGECTVYVKYGKKSLPVQIKVLPVELKSIQLIEKGRTEYLSEEHFSPKGFKLQAIYSDGAIEEIQEFEYSNSPLRESQHFCFLQFGAKTVTVPIIVTSNNLREVKIHSLPKKLTYIRGEPLDLTGGSLLVIKNTGEQQMVPMDEDMLVSYSTKRLGPKTILLSYLGRGFSFDIQVNVPNRVVDKETVFVETPANLPKKDVENKPQQEEADPPKTEKANETTYCLAFIKIPESNVFSVGEVLVADKFLICKKNIKTGSFTLLKDFSIFPDRALRTTDKEVVFSCQDPNCESMTWPISVQDKIIKTVIISTMPQKLEYTQGTKQLDLTDGKLTVFYHDGSNEVIPITPNMISEFDGEKIGSQIVYVNYGGQHLAMQVIISERKIQKISVKTPPHKTHYIDGECLDLSGLVLSVQYNNGDIEEVSDYKPQMPVKVLQGQAVIKMHYCNASFPVFIHVSPKNITGIRIYQQPFKTEYIEGIEPLDITGGEIEELYSNGTSEIIKLTDKMISGFENSKAGKCELTVTHKGFSCHFDVTIKPKTITAIVLAKDPARICYTEGEAFDPKGMELKAEYDNKTQEIIHEFEIKPEKLDLTTTHVTISYKGKSVEVPVQIQSRKVESIVIAKTPDKLHYMEGQDSLDVSGGQLLVLYNNGTAETIDMTMDMISGFDNSKSGTNTIKVHYKETFTTYDIIIDQKQILGITISKNANKTTYKPGDFFDTSGMIVTGFYNNNTTAEITNYEYTPKRELNETDTAIMIDYMGKTAFLPIVVSNEIIEENKEISHTDLSSVSTTSAADEKTENPAATIDITTEKMSKPSLESTPQEPTTTKQDTTSLKKEPAVLTIPRFYAGSGDLRFKDDENIKMFLG